MNNSELTQDQEKKKIQAFKLIAEKDYPKEKVAYTANLQYCKYTIEDPAISKKTK